MSDNFARFENQFFLSFADYFNARKTQIFVDGVS